MKYDPEKHHRRSIRLKEYDYSQSGAYFVTTCTYQRKALFGKVEDGRMRLNEYGHIVAECWAAIPAHFEFTEVDAMVIMPNHLHGIISVVNRNNVGATHASPLPTFRPSGPKPKSVGAIIGSFKSAVSKQLNRLRDTPGVTVWQRNYHDRIIRVEDDLNRIRAYIQNNPLNWETDENNILGKII